MHDQQPRSTSTFDYVVVAPVLQGPSSQSGSAPATRSPSPPDEPGRRGHLPGLNDRGIGQNTG